MSLDSLILDVTIQNKWLEIVPFEKLLLYFHTLIKFYTSGLWHRDSAVLLWESREQTKMLLFYGFLELKVLELSRQIVSWREKGASYPLVWTLINWNSPELYFEKMCAHSSPLCARLLASRTLCQASRLWGLSWENREMLKTPMDVWVISRPLPRR